MAVYLYLINSDAILNGKKVNNSSKLFWVSNDEEKKELSEAFNEIGRENTAKSVSKGYVYMVDKDTFSELENSQNVTIRKASGKPHGIESALGMKVYNANKKVMEICDHFPLSIFKIMKNDNTTVGREGNKTKNNNSIKKKDNTSTWKKDNPEI